MKQRPLSLFPLSSLHISKNPAWHCMRWPTRWLTYSNVSPLKVSAASPGSVASCGEAPPGGSAPPTRHPPPPLAADGMLWVPQAFYLTRRAAGAGATVARPRMRRATGVVAAHLGCSTPQW